MMAGWPSATTSDWTSSGSPGASRRTRCAAVQTPDVLEGGPEADTLEGLAGDDKLLGDAGTGNTLEGSGGEDYVDGQRGRDQIDRRTPR